MGFLHNLQSDLKVTLNPARDAEWDFAAYAPDGVPNHPFITETKADPSGFINLNLSVAGVNALLNDDPGELPSISISSDLLFRLQYVHARCCAVVAMAGEARGEPNPYEKNLIRQIALIPASRDSMAGGALRLCDAFDALWQHEMPYGRSSLLRALRVLAARLIVAAGDTPREELKSEG